MVSIWKTVDLLLPQDQYFFIYEAVAEWIVCGNTEVPLEQLADYVNDLYQIIPEDDVQDTTYIELEFKVGHLSTPVATPMASTHPVTRYSLLQRLAIDKNDPHRFASAGRDVNKSKNRYVNVLACERVWHGWDCIRTTVLT